MTAVSSRTSEASDYERDTPDGRTAAERAASMSELREGLTLLIPPDFVEAIVSAVIARVVGELRSQAQIDAWPAWMSVDTTARYLDVSPERVRKCRLGGTFRFIRRRPAAASSSAAPTSTTGCPAFASRRAGRSARVDRECGFAVLT